MIEGKTSLLTLSVPLLLTFILCPILVNSVVLDKDKNVVIQGSVLASDFALADGSYVTEHLANLTGDVSVLQAQVSPGRIGPVLSVVTSTMTEIAFDGTYLDPSASYKASVTSADYMQLIKTCTLDTNVLTCGFSLGAMLIFNESNQKVGQFYSAEVTVAGIGDLPGVMNIPLSGTVSDFKIRHVSGTLSNSVAEDWKVKTAAKTCKIILVRGDGITPRDFSRTVAPRYIASGGSHVYDCDAYATETTMDYLQYPFEVHNEPFALWMAEDFMNYTESDNSGSAVYQLFFQFN